MTSTRRINFEDCDPFSHLNNANYLIYFLNLNLFEQIALFPGEKIADFSIGDRLKQIRSELA